MNNDYITSDLFLTTHLLLCGAKLKEVKRINPNQGEFIFEKPPREFIDSYFNETKKFATKKVLQELKTLKNRIYNTPL